MDDKNRKGVFIKFTDRADLLQLIADLKEKTGIKSNAELFYQAVRRWAAAAKKKPDSKA